MAVRSGFRLKGNLPLGHIKLDASFPLEMFITLLNGKVFFWPGKEIDHPIDYGVRHKESNDWRTPWVVLRVPSELIIAKAKFSRCNSGAPRTSNGKKASRGAKTFLTASEFEGSLSKVVEVVFDEEVTLPASTAARHIDYGDWSPLFSLESIP